MISLSQALAFGLAAMIIIVIPGPSVLFVVGRALAYGRRTALVSVVGNELGALVVAGAVALGIGEVVERSVALFTAIKLCGAAYLVFLGTRALLRGRGHVDVRTDPYERGGVPLQMFTLGLVFVLIALICDSTWSLAASGTRAWFGRSPRRLRMVGGAGGLAMIGLGLGIAVTGRKD